MRLWLQKAYSDEKYNIACHINKQRMSQSLAVAVTSQVNPEGTQEGKNTCHLAAIRQQTLPMVNPEETLGMKTASWPWIAKVHIKGMISVSQDSCISPYIEQS